MKLSPMHPQTYSYPMAIPLAMQLAMYMCILPYVPLQGDLVATLAAVAMVIQDKWPWMQIWGYGIITDSGYALAYVCQL